MTDHFDPEPGDRVYVRSSTTGNLGWMVRRDATDMVRLDRSAQEIVVPFSGEWQQVVEHRPCSHAQVVQVAYVADQALCKLLGMYETDSKSRDRLTGPNARKEFRDLTDKQRIAWLNEGPTNPPIRQILYSAVMGVLSEHMVAK